MKNPVPQSLPSLFKSIPPDFFVSLLNLCSPRAFHLMKMLEVAEPEQLPVAQARAGEPAAWNEKDDGGKIFFIKGGSVDREKGDWVWQYPLK